MSMFANDEEEKKATLITTSSVSIKLTQYTISEIELITTVIHQYLERSLHSSSSLHTASTSLSSSKRQEINNFFQNLLKQFAHTRRSLSLSPSSLNPFECIYPFCLVIKQNESPSSITAVSINYATNMLNDPFFLNKSSPHIKQCIQCIGDTICCVILDVEQKEFDQGLLLKFMNLISCLLHHSCFIFLSESMIWNIFDKLLYIYFNVNADHHSQALFEFAEITMNLLIQKVFQQLPRFMNMNKDTAVHIINVNVDEAATKMHAHAKGYLSLKDKILKHKNKAVMEPLQSMKSLPERNPFHIDCLVRILSALCSGDPCSFDGGELNVDDDDEVNENRLIICLNLILIALRESGEYFERIPRILSLMTNNLCYILLKFGSNTKYIMLYELCLRTYIELLYKLRKKMKLQNEILFRMLFIRTLKYSLPKGLKREQSGLSNDCLFDTDRVDEILSKQMNTDINPTNEAIQIQEEKQSYDISSMSLMTNDGSIMSTATTAATATATVTTHTVRTNNESVSVASRSHKKKKENNNMIFVVCALEHLVDLCDKIWFLPELFLNYDCCLYSSNLCNDLISLLSAHTMPGNGRLLSKHYLALQCLVNITNALHDNDDDDDGALDINHLRDVREKKNILRRGVDIFNKNPEKGILYLYDNGIFGRRISRKVFTKTTKKKNNSADDMLRYEIGQMIDSTDIVEQIVDILFYFPGCNDLRIGYYLGSEHILNERVRNRYIERRYSFAGLSFDSAMRLFFEDFRLPVETQQVDRIVESFAAKYCLDNEADARWNMSPSTTYTLCFALMMLHTTQHNESLKRNKRMKLEEFVKLVRMVKDAQNIEMHLLELLYDSMTQNEIKLSHDETSNNLSKLNWNLLIQHNDDDYVNMNRLCNAHLLNIIFAPISTTFGFILDVICKQNIIEFCIPTDGDALISMICNGFYHLALFIAQNNDNKNDENEMDLLMLRLSQLSGLCQVNCAAAASQYSKSYGKKEISHLLFNILYEFGANCLSANGWNHILQIIMQCARSSLLPLIMYQLDDFVGGELAGRPLNRSFKYLFRLDEHLIDEEFNDLRDKQQEDEEQTLFGTISKFIDYFNIANDSTLGSKQREKEEEKLLRSAQIILSDFCQIHLIMKKSAQFNIESVRNLCDSLITNSDFGILHAQKGKNQMQNIEILAYKIDCSPDILYVYSDRLRENQQPILQRSCLSVQFLTCILLHNWRRIHFLWDIFMAHLKHLLDINDVVYNEINDELSPLHEAMVESAVISILKICVRALQLPCNNTTQCMLSAFKLISCLSPNNFHRYRNVSYQITAALHRFIKQLYHKKQLYLKHKHAEIAALSAQSSSSSISSMRSRHAKRLSDYQWWSVTPFCDIFKLIKTGASKSALCDICAKIFVHILGVSDDKNQSKKDKKLLLFLPHNPHLMDEVVEILDIFVKHKQFRSHQTIKVMIVNAIGNVLNEMEYFYQIINDDDDDNKIIAPGNLDKKQAIFEYIAVLLNYMITLCGSASCGIRSKALLLLEYILFKSPICETFIDHNIHFMINEVILNALCNQLIRRQLLAADAPFIAKSRAFAVSLLNRYFLLHIDELFAANNFKQIWMEILCCSDIMLEMKSDPKYSQLYVEIKENLKNVLKVMIGKNILSGSQNDHRDNITSLTWCKINDMFPRMKSELFQNSNNDKRDLLHPTPTATDTSIIT